MIIYFKDLINNRFYNKRCRNRSLRLSVRTRGFHPRKRGSIPLGTAIMSYFVYLIVTKNERNRLTSYVGYTNNLKERINKHNSSKGAKSTRGYKWEIIYKKRFTSKSKAMSFEYLLKKDRKKRLSILKELE